jgi:hypothetical protein
MQEKSSTQSPHIPQQLWFEFSGLALMTAEVLLLISWYGALILPTSAWLFSGVMLGMIYISSHFLFRLMDLLNWNLLIRRIVLIFWVLLCMTYSTQHLLYPAETLSFFELLLRPITDLAYVNAGMQSFWHVILISLLIWRGVSLASQSADEEICLKSLRIGLILFLLFGIFFSTAKSLSVMVSFFGGYLFCILVALSAARIGELGKLRGGKIPQINPAWILGILGCTLLIVVTALFSGWVFSFEEITTLITTTVIFLFVGLTMAFVMLLSPLLTLIVWLASKLPQLQEFPLDMESGAEYTVEEVESIITGAVNTQDWLTTIGRPLLLIGILLTIVISTIIGLRIRARRKHMAVEEQSSPINNRKKMSALPNLIPASEHIKRALNLRRLWNAARIRYVYARLLELSARLGKVRKSASTPLEFQTQLSALFPDHIDNLGIITQAYIKTRYGEVPETDLEVKKVMSAWENIQVDGKRKHKENNRQKRRR